MSTNYSMGDGTNTPVRLGRKHRRGRGQTPPNRKNTTAPGHRNAAAGTNASGRPQNWNAAAPVPTSNSFWPKKSATERSVGKHHRKPQPRPQTSPPPQANFVTSDAWNMPIKGSNHGDDDGTGSLDYSASSSVQSAESSNDSSFSAILKSIDSSSEGDNVIFQAASGDMGHAQCGRMRGMGMEVEKDTAAVAGWNQRWGQQQQTAQPRAQQAPPGSLQLATKPQYSMARGPSTSEHVDLNYSKDDSSEDDVYGVDFNEQEESVLETIAGKQDDDITSTKPPATPHRHSLPDHFSRYTSAAPSPPRNLGHVTPPPNARQRRTSTPPGAATPLSRTSSRHSKSSSDGSLDTPAPRSPPGHAKPPSARGAAGGAARRASAVAREERVVEDLSEAFYAKSWMCGFADAFNF